MLQRRLFMSAFFILAIISLGQAQYESHIVARGFSKYNNSKVEVHFTDYNENGWVKKIYSSTVADGKFKIKTTMMNPSCKGYISFPLQKRQYLLILDSGILHVELPAGQKINPNLVKTSPANDLFWKVNRIKIEHQSEENQSVRDLRLKTLQVIKDNPNNYCSLIELGQLSYLIFSLKTEEIISAFESLEENNKQTNMGLWLGNRLKEYGNALEGKQLPIFSLFDETRDAFFK